MSPGGYVIATAGNDRTARLWDWRTGSEATPPLAHGSRVVDVAFNSDGGLIVTASEDNAARVWDCSSGQPVTPFLWHNGSVRRARFSPDSRFVLTSDKGEMAHLWDSSTGEEIMPVRKSESWVLAVLSSRRAAGIWNVPPDERSVETLALLAQWHSGHRVDQFGGLTPLAPADFAQLAAQLRTIMPAWPGP